jgi:hypothetical protein
MMRAAFIAAALVFGLGGSAHAGNPPVSIFSGTLTPLGYCQITATSSAVAVATANCAHGSVPTDATVADVIIETQGVRYRDDGTAPTTTVGMPLATGTEKIFAEQNFGAIQFIATTAGAIIDISFYQ